LSLLCVVFFFQAEDGIRDATVTGVQTCALPIYVPHGERARQQHRARAGAARAGARGDDARRGSDAALPRPGAPPPAEHALLVQRSEERRVGKEWSSGWWADPSEKQRKIRGALDK